MALLQTLLLIINLLVLSQSQRRPTFNVGTVLFTTADTRRECYSADEVALMTTRMMLEDMLPAETELNIKSNEYVLDLIDYFRLMLEVVRNLSSGKSKHIVLIALTDTLGGYMRHLVLPLAKFAYYAGQIRYSTVIKLYQLYDELKLYLRTDGQGWRKPREGLGANTEAEELSMDGALASSDPCKGIIYSRQPAGKRHKKSLDESAAASSHGGCNMVIPMPFFDSKTYPSAIAVPFKAFSLRNLESRSSAYILVKLYSSVIRCMAQKNAAEQSVQQFNNELFSFLTSKVMPRLEDEKFYAAFGGVLRVMASLRKSGSLGSEKEIGNYNVMPEEENVEKEEFNEEDFDAAPGPDKKGKSNLILMAALITIAIWFILGALFICCKIRASRKKDACPGLEYKPSKTKSVVTCEGSRRGSSQDRSSSSKRSKRSMASKKSSDKICTPCGRSSSKTSTKSSSRPKKSRSSSRCSSGGSNKSSNKSSTRCSSRGASNKSKSASESGASYCTRESCKNIQRKKSSGTSFLKKGSSKKLVKITDSRSKSSKRTTSRSRSTVCSNKSEQDSESGQYDDTTTSTQHASSKGNFYPAYYACHSSLTGHYKHHCKVGSSSDDGKKKKQFVFGYDFRTTSTESSPRECEDDHDLDGNASR